MEPDTMVAAVAAKTNCGEVAGQSVGLPLMYLEEPLGILVVFQLVVEVLRPTTEQVAI